MLALVKHFKQIDIRIYAVLISIVFSLLATHSHDPINLDGIVYLRTANTYLQDGLHAAKQIYPWPFYSILIAILSKFAHLSLIHSSRVINIFLISTLVAAFITLVKEIGGSKTVQWLAMLTILAYPGINNEREMVLRDFGYMAFSLLAIIQFIRFSHTQSLRHALGWGIAMCVATVFRIEGAVFLLFVPFSLLFMFDFSLSQRIAAFIKASSLLILCTLAISLWVLSHPNHSFDQLGRIPEFLTQIRSGALHTIEIFNTKAAILAQAILEKYSMNNAGTMLFGGMVAVFLTTFFSTLTLLYLLLSIYGIFYKLLPSDRITKIILVTFIVLNFIVTTVFLAQMQFLTNRYVMPLCLLCMLIVPFSLAKIYLGWRPWAALTVSIWLTIMTVSGIFHFSHTKAHLLEAANWIRVNTAPQAMLYSNSKEIAFYAQRPGTNWEADFDKPLRSSIASQDQGKKYNYVALRFNRQEQNEIAKMIATLGISPIQTFANQRGDKVLIFKTSTPINYQSNAQKNTFPL